MSCKIYNYDSTTRIYVGESEAPESPLEPGVYLIPAHATTIAPPGWIKATGASVPLEEYTKLMAGKVERFKQDGKSWETIEDVRGTWYSADGRAVEISDIDADVSALTREAPPDETYVLIKGKWQQDSKKAAAAKKAAADLEVAEGLAAANQQIAVLQDAVDLEMATAEEETQLKAWKKYRVLLTRAHADAKYPDVTLPKRPEV